MKDTADRTAALTEPVIAIGTIAEKTGLSVSAVRKYETEGLLIPHRTSSGHRLFSHEDLERVKILRHMVQEMGLNMEGIRRLQALLPCWELAGCSEDKRKRCPVRKQSSQPCWMVKHEDAGPRAAECRKCVVYRFGAQCTEDVKRVIFGKSGAEGFLEEMQKTVQKEILGR